MNARVGLTALLVTAACSPAAGADRTVVASVHPLAFVAEQVAGPGWTVVDLTPPGTEAHDVELSLEQRARIQDADAVLYLGDVGFQPQLEAAVGETQGVLVSVADVLASRGDPPSLERDPHVWLDPRAMATIAEAFAAVLGRLDRENAQRYAGGAESLGSELRELEGSFRTGLEACELDTAIVTHEAFGYLLDPFGITQVGLSGRTPEVEPSATRLARARALLRDGEAGAVFYEEHADSARVAETLASDAGVPALPLRTLESAPAGSEYLTVMRDNLASLREGLRCP